MARLSLSPPRAPRAPLSYPPNGLRAFPCQTCLCKPQKKKKTGVHPPRQPDGGRAQPRLCLQQHLLQLRGRQPGRLQGGVGGGRRPKVRVPGIYVCSSFTLVDMSAVS